MPHWSFNKKKQKAQRLITNSHRFAPTESLLTEYHILVVERICLFSVQIHMFKLFCLQCFRISLLLMQMLTIMIWSRVIYIYIILQLCTASKQAIELELPAFSNTRYIFKYPRVQLLYWPIKDISKTSFDIPCCLPEQTNRGCIWGLWCRRPVSGHAWVIAFNSKP